MVDGTLQLVTIEPLGSTLIAAAAVGAVTLSVDWAVDFAEDGGQCRVNGGTPLEFTSADQDADTVTLAKPLTTAAEIGDPIDVLNVRDQPAQKWVAVVELADDQEPIDAIIPLGLIPHFREGDEQAGQQVSLRRDEHGDYIVTGRPDDTPEREVLAAQAGIVVAGPGQAKITLPWEPMENSEHLYWNGIYQPGTEWSRLERTITVPDPDNLLRAGDELDVEYLYYSGQLADLPPSVEITDVGGSIGTEVPGALTPNTGKNHTALPAGTQPGDLIVVAARGYVSASGNDTATGLSLNDSRFTEVYKKVDYTADPSGEVVGVWVGTADGSGAEIVVDIAADGSHGLFPGCNVVVARLRDANGVGTPQLVRPAWPGAVPAITAAAVVAVSWVKTSGFVAISTGHPDGYTRIVWTGIGYQSIAISYTTDPQATVINQASAALLLPVI